MFAEEVRLELTHAIERELSFLRARGYEFAGVRECATEALGAYLEGSYTNTAANRVVRVEYLPGHNAPRSVAITRVGLVVPEPVDEFDYTSLGSMEVCVTDLSAAGGFAAGLGHHLRDSARALRDRFGDVLTGQVWQTDHLDWGGLK